MTKADTKSRLGDGAQFGFNLWREAMRWQRQVNRALKPLGLTHSQILVLAALDRVAREAGGEVNQAAISAEAGLDPGTTGAIVGTLDEAGYLERDVAFPDRRSWLVAMTKRGERALTAAVPLLEAAANGISRPRR